MNKRKIHIIDDQIAFTKILKKCLEQTGNYETRIENNSTKAVEAIRDFKPDLILLDIMMPNINGNKIAEYIQNDKRLKHIKIVFLTAIGMNSVAETKVSGIAGFTCLTKPVKLEKLIECVEQQLS